MTPSEITNPPGFHRNALRVAVKVYVRAAHLVFLAQLVYVAGDIKMETLFRFSPKACHKKEFCTVESVKWQKSSHEHDVEVRDDEAHFWLNGYVNKQNCRIWSEANPQVYVETLLHPEKLTVWCALRAGGILLQKR
ncbi:hypothetical protein TNCV_449701 [Trichonephila clavipes]|nr:hypothetical protein TNCV_449701 [Trichonephila clavipes]